MGTWIIIGTWIIMNIKHLVDQKHTRVTVGQENTSNALAKLFIQNVFKAIINLFFSLSTCHTSSAHSLS